MALLLDTNVISASRRAGRQPPEFQAFLRRFDAADAYISTISIMEIEFGIMRESGRDTAFAADLTTWLETIVVSSFAGRILDFDLAAARRCGSLPTPSKRPTADAMIAASALEHALTVVTRNVADFEPLGVSCIDPWHSPIAG